MDSIGIQGKREIQQVRKLLRDLVQIFSAVDKYSGNCCGLTLSQCHILGELGRRGTVLSLGDLAQAIRSDPGAVSRVIDSLVKLGLVNRRPQPEDRRFVCLTLTREGERVFREIERRMNNVIALALEELSPGARKTFISSLATVVDTLEKTGCCPPAGQEKQRRVVRKASSFRSGN